MKVNNRVKTPDDSQQPAPTCLKSYAVELTAYEENSLKARYGVHSDGELRQYLERMVKDLIFTQCESPTEIKEELVKEDLLLEEG